MDGSGEKQKAQHDFHQDSSKIKRTGKLSGFFKQCWKKRTHNHDYQRRNQCNQHHPNGAGQLQKPEIDLPENGC